MQGNRRADTQPEVALRRALHARGLRFRKDRLIDTGDRRVKADVVFSRRRVAIFLDGCFWHGCPVHCRMPASNVDYWHAKIERNKARDRRTDEALTAGGWQVLRFWEHVPVEEAVRVVARALRK